MAHTRSTIRTLKTKASEGMRIAKQNMDGIALIRDNLTRGTEEYKVAHKCFLVAENTYTQQKAVYDNLGAEQKEVGGYKKQPKAEQEEGVVVPTQAELAS